jgi:hypothetical protein
MPVKNKNLKLNLYILHSTGTVQVTDTNICRGFVINPRQSLQSHHIFKKHFRKIGYKMSSESELERIYYCLDSLETALSKSRRLHPQTNAMRRHQFLKKFFLSTMAFERTNYFKSWTSNSHWKNFT